MEEECFRLTLKRSAEETKAGQGPGPEASMFKYYGTELNIQKYELMISLLGMQGLGWEGEGFEPDAVRELCFPFGVVSGELVLVGFDESFRVIM